MIRYELEKLLIGGAMNVKDIPAYWNDQYLQLMGVKVPGDKKGCLQDVHWSHGSFGYFPTYSLGSFYAAQFYQHANQSITNLNEHIKQGNTMPLLQWLRKTVHEKGRRFTSEELCKDICGETLNIQYFTGYLLDKFKDIYKF
jgi:carboxypeptidase Taq